MDMDYDFIWRRRQPPSFILPNGLYLYLEVRDNIPYLRKGSRPTTALPPPTFGSECPAPARVADPEDGAAPVAVEAAPDDAAGISGPEVEGRELADALGRSLKAVANSTRSIFISTLAAGQDEEQTKI